MFRILKRYLQHLNRYLEELYARRPGCCASGGLSVSELNGEEKTATKKGHT
jgi:hypothetical protein